MGANISGGGFLSGLGSFTTALQSLRTLIKNTLFTYTVSGSHGTEGGYYYGSGTSTNKFALLIANTFFFEQNAGEKALFLQSSDLETWTDPDILLDQSFVDAVYDETLGWFILAQQGPSKYSSNGTTWVDVTLPEGATNTWSNIGNTVLGGSGRFVVFNKYNQKLYTSTNGTTWTLAFDFSEEVPTESGQNSFTYYYDGPSMMGVESIEVRYIGDVIYDPSANKYYVLANMVSEYSSGNYSYTCYLWPIESNFTGLGWPGASNVPNFIAGKSAVVNGALILSPENPNTFSQYGIPDLPLTNYGFRDTTVVPLSSFTSINKITLLSPTDVADQVSLFQMPYWIPQEELLMAPLVYPSDETYDYARSVITLYNLRAFENDGATEPVNVYSNRRAGFSGFDAGGYAPDFGAYSPIAFAQDQSNINIIHMYGSDYDVAAATNFAVPGIKHKTVEFQSYLGGPENIMWWSGTPHDNLDYTWNRRILSLEYGAFTEPGGVGGQGTPDTYLEQLLPEVLFETSTQANYNFVLEVENTTQETQYYSIYLYSFSWNTISERYVPYSYDEPIAPGATATVNLLGMNYAGYGSMEINGQGWRGIGETYMELYNYYSANKLAISVSATAADKVRFKLYQQ